MGTSKFTSYLTLQPGVTDPGPHYEDGEVLAFQGPAPAGPTTPLSLCAGMWLPDQGWKKLSSTAAREMSGLRWWATAGNPVPPLSRGKVSFFPPAAQATPCQDEVKVSKG